MTGWVKPGIVCTFQFAAKWHTSAREWFSPLKWFMAAGNISTHRCNSHLICVRLSHFGCFTVLRDCRKVTTSEGVLSFLFLLKGGSLTFFRRAGEGLIQPSLVIFIINKKGSK